MAWDWEKLQQQKKKGTGGAPPPQMGEVIDKLRGAKGKIPGLWILIIGFLVFYLVSNCFFTVEPNEVGVVQRFGKYKRSAPPGLNIKFPRGIEKVTKVKVDYTNKEEFGFRTIKAGVRTQYASGSAYLTEALMLTGDLNVAVVPWVVQYRIKDEYKFLFKVRNPISTLRDLSEGVMRLVVGDRSVYEVISNRKVVADAAKKILQEELDMAETGIKVVNIELKETNVPETVQPSFNEVNRSIQEKEKMIYQANEAYNKVIPAAEGNAEKTIRAAEGYALDRVNRAEGDASKFIALYEEYSKAEDVTRRRLYLEALSDIFTRLGSKYIIDSNQKNLLPLLNLGKPGGGKP